MGSYEDEIALQILDLMMESELDASIESNDLGYTLKKLLYDQDGIFISVVVVVPAQEDRKLDTF
jgi:hypothetical protein